jgi:hypothetical protein
LFFHGSSAQNGALFLAPWFVAAQVLAEKGVEQMKPYFAAGVTFVAGMILGVYLSRPATARAQAGTVVHLTWAGGHKQESVSISGEVIVFACGSENKCYILSR